jgi:hypothetical protein
MRTRRRHHCLPFCSRAIFLASVLAAVTLIVTHALPRRRRHGARATCVSDSSLSLSLSLSLSVCVCVGDPIVLLVCDNTGMYEYRSPS